MAHPPSAEIAQVIQELRNAIVNGPRSVDPQILASAADQLSQLAAQAQALIQGRHAMQRRSEAAETDWEAAGATITRGPDKAAADQRAAVNVPRLDLATFTRTERRLPYMGYYFASQHLNLIPRGSFVIVREDELRPGLGQDLATGGLFAILQLGDHAEMFTDDAQMHRRFEQAQAGCERAGVVPVAISIREEWYLAVNDGNEVANWPYFAGITDQLARRDRLRARLEFFYATLKTYFPGALTWACETLWNADRSIPWPYYCPPYGADVLFIDAYLYRQPWLAHAPIAYEPVDDQNMLNKFAGEVALLVSHACTFGKPVIVVGQSSTFEGPITPGQLEWFYILAQRLPQVVGIAWFAVSKDAGGYLTAGCEGLKEKVEELAAFNRS